MMTPYGARADDGRLELDPLDEFANAGDEVGVGGLAAGGGRSQVIAQGGGLLGVAVNGAGVLRFGPR